MSQPFGGPWMDSSGNPLENGYLTVHMLQDALSNSRQLCAGRGVKVKLDNGGNFPSGVTLATTTSMNPSDTVYIVSAYTAEGQLVWGPNSQTLS